MIETIYLDMDEVLVEFCRGYCEYIGVDYQEVLKNWPRGEWYITPALSKVLGYEVTIQDFWSKINGDYQFWLNLKECRWCDDLIELCKKYTNDVHIVSSPSYCHTSYTGKVKWLKYKFGAEYTTFHLTPHKEKLARHGTVLIDDNENNCYNFIMNRKTGRSTGARSIVFPRHSNGMGDIPDPVTYIQTQLDDILQEWS